MLSGNSVQRASKLGLVASEVAGNTQCRDMLTLVVFALNEAIIVELYRVLRNRKHNSDA